MQRRIAAAAICLVALSACQRETRDLRPSPTRTVVYGDAAREDEIQPGGAHTQPIVGGPYESNAYAISEGSRLYGWYNCAGCHFHGGGGIGPPLMKNEGQWIYGAQPANVFDTIIKGRPNGMPAWGGKIPEYQVWQIVAYVRSLSGLEPQTATPGREDGLESKK